MSHDDRRLIEDYLPIQAISAEASREKSVRKGHISTLHLWWARRPLVACRAAVYGALVPASQFVPNGASDEKKKSLGRANAAKFVERLCQYPGVPQVINEAQEHILAAHAERLTRELAEARARGGESAWAKEFSFTDEAVTVEDIETGRAPRPRVLDMFAGGGAIPLEALRLGCEAHALDLNPVAHLIQLCTLVYPQKFGWPDPAMRGSAPNGTWAGLAAEVEHWGRWVLEKVRAEIGDLYPSVPDPEARDQPVEEPGFDGPQKQLALDDEAQLRLCAKPKGKGRSSRSLTPVAYLWTRTVRCKNPACGATVPLVKQTWLCKKQDRNVALRVVAPPGKKRVRFEIVEARTEAGLGFDPEAFSKGGNATCVFCGSVADDNYVQSEGCAKRTGRQLMAIVAVSEGRRGKVYLAADSCPDAVPSDSAIDARLSQTSGQTGFPLLSEPINPLRPSPNARGMSAVTRHGLAAFGDLFSNRQMLTLMTFAKHIRSAETALIAAGIEGDRRKAVSTYLAFALDKIAEIGNNLGRWEPVAQCTRTLFGRHALSMMWDYGETVPIASSAGNWTEHLGRVVESITLAVASGLPANVSRGSATSLGWASEFFDAVITDPPYYDNVPYADVSDFFYVWLKRSVGHLYPEHFAADLTPKRAEATALSSRHRGDMEAATSEYETMMRTAFTEAARTLKRGGEMTVVYAHKTTLGWSTLVDALRLAGFMVVEAWPLDTENQSRLVAKDSAALASSIFLIARKRDNSATGSYENTVRPELDQIVRERVETLWRMGITGADLIIAAVGAGLRAFTRFARVEFANGEEVPAEKFLGEVESVVLETLLEKIFGLAGSGVSAVDGPSRFYVLWRFAYQAAELDAGEAIVFTYGQPVELDGADGVATGALALVEKKKGKYRLHDFTERGPLERLGLPANDGKPASLIDMLHRVLWLMENEPRKLPEFFDEARPDRERLRLVAQTLAGAGLSGGGEEQTTVLNTTPAEQAALNKLLANWRSLVPESLFTGTRR